MNVIVARHGVTQANIGRITNGRSDDMLTDEGRKQAEELVNKLKDYKFDSIFSSPLKRATETALPIAEATNSEINIDIRLIEVDFGIFTKKPYSEIEKVTGKTGTEMLNDYKFDFPEGETSEEVEERVRSFIDELKAKQYKNVLVVTHGGILRWIAYIITGVRIGPQLNASVHKFTL